MRRGHYVAVTVPCKSLARARETWLSPTLEAYMRRWVSAGRTGQAFIDESYWRWLLAPDENLKAVRAMTPEELNARLPDSPEAIDGEWHQSWRERVLEAVLG